MVKTFIFSLLFILSVNHLRGQNWYEPVFKDLRDQTLFDSLVSAYKTYSLLSYSTCRDTLFSKIDAEKDSLECIYTGMKRYLPPGTDPTDAVLLNGQPNGINTEHAYPQSKGANGYGRSDMHILYPSRVRTNTNRGNIPFGEIPDLETEVWYYLTNELTFPPSVNRDAYSEGKTTRFEPREKVKGNLARSVFYFYTLYRSDAVNADPEFFNTQLQDLCDWHFADPVDSIEWIRNKKIQRYQGNYNPFVLDCSLAGRLYCPDISSTCEKLVSVNQQKFDNLVVYPNPGSGHFNVFLPSFSGWYVLNVTNLQGESVYESTGFMTDSVAEFDLPETPAGIYFIHFCDKNRGTSRVFRYVLIP